jgi:hypothetical protein
MENKRRALISGEYYDAYVRVLRIAVPIVASIVSIVHTVGYFLGTDTSLIIGPAVIGTFIGFIIGVVASVFSALLQTFAIVTLIFAILDYKSVDLAKHGVDDITLKNSFETDEDDKFKISISDPLVSISVNVTLTILLLGFPQIMSWLFDGEWIPVLDVNVVRGMWFPIVVWTAFEIAAEAVKIIDGRYTMRVAGVMVISGIASAVFAIMVFGNPDILNPEFVYNAENFGYVLDFQALGFNFRNAAAQPNLIVLTIMLIVVAIETIYTVAKALQARNHS